MSLLLYCDHSILKRNILPFQRNSAKQYRKSHYSPTVPFIEDADWVEPGTAQLSVAANIHEEKNPKMNKPLHLMIPLKDLPQYSTLAAEVMNHPENDWVFACNANQWTKDKVMQIWCVLLYKFLDFSVFVRSRFLIC